MIWFLVWVNNIIVWQHVLYYTHLLHANLPTAQASERLLCGDKLHIFITLVTILEVCETL